MSDKREVICKSCGHVSVEYRHSLNESIISLLILLFEKDVPLQASAQGLNYTKRCNSQKLTYWGFIEPYITLENQRKRGWWRITKKGRSFMRGEISVSKTAITREGKVIAFSGPQVRLTDIKAEYKYRGDWADEARQQIIFEEL